MCHKLVMSKNGDKDGSERVSSIRYGDRLCNTITLGWRPPEVKEQAAQIMGGSMRLSKQQVQRP
jgi:hypothetical protein